MADSINGSSSFWAQANALFRKNLTFQRRNFWTNLRLVLFPLLLCLFLFIAQTIINKLRESPNGGGRQNGDRKYSHLDQVPTRSVHSTLGSSPISQLPDPQHRLLRTQQTDFVSFGDMAGETDSCTSTGSCRTIVLMTGNNQSLLKSVARNMFPKSSNYYPSSGLADAVLGSASNTEISNFLEPAFFSSFPVYYVQSRCGANSKSAIASMEVEKEVRCVHGLHMWRNGSSEVNNEPFVEYRKGNSKEKINDILAGYDFLNSNISNFNVTVWYNSTNKIDKGKGHFALDRVSRSINLVSNAYLRHLVGSSVQTLFDTVKMYKPETRKREDDVSLLIGPLFFSWVILQLFPVVLTALVYEKQQNLRIMMKMHGLGDGPYWMISYAYFLAISSAYMFCFVVFGSVVGLQFFTMNDYSIQFVFYFIYINLQISVAFLVAALFTKVKTASVVGYILVFVTGLTGGFLFQAFLRDISFPRGWIFVMELYPGFSLSGGLYEFSDYAARGNQMGTRGMQWGDISDEDNEMRRVLIIMLVEWLVAVFVGYYIDQVVTSGSGVRKGPLFFLEKFKRKPSLSLGRPGLQRQASQVLVQMEKPDVVQERERVEQLLLEQDTSHAIVCDNLKKVYPGRDGNPEKVAVRGLSLALSQAECFGVLGPNGAGKTSFINMMIGLIKPSSGTAYVQGLDIRTNMDGIYTSMGVCPQHDLLWETLTGREHLLFYGRLKNLKGTALTQAVEESLRSVNLLNGGVADKQAGKYSGGMKRRLSVAISLIGDPKVVYMDEPSSGLDPASRNNLWNVVKQAKRNRAIILTTHSMEEAEHLCDRLGIFVDGSLQCVGNPRELKGRYGGSYVFTMTTSPNHEADVENLVKGLSPNANKIYQISGTQKFELPKQAVKIAKVFRAVEDAKRRFAVQAWGIADTTLEDVFIKVAREAQSFDVFS